MTGVNTGFGGSADTRTRGVQELQLTLIRELHYGILNSSSAQASAKEEEKPTLRPFRKHVLPPAEVTLNEIPHSWVRAALLIRLNSLVSGYSSVRLVVVQRMCDLLNLGITPQVPLRGSISASGDLSPLSYLSGAIQGKSTINVWTRSLEGGSTLVTAAQALADNGLSRVDLGPKEGLAIVNGTAISAGAAALAMHEAHHLVVLAQVMTAMSVEALCGTDESFDPLFAKVRPHPGQIEASNNILHFLRDSKLICRHQSRDDALRQDRYSIRTAAQWIGPALEDLALAHHQIVIEINSVTDNPLIDASNNRSLHGGNFQARSLTSATEKTRSAIQTIGRMLFTQCTELINPATSQGLPPNLVADEPSSSFVMKAVDLMVAALQSELGFLANPVGSHVQTAEMGNQALNSLALISARYTHTAVDVLSQLAAAHLLALCQALDLRAMMRRFLEQVKPGFVEKTMALLKAMGMTDVSSWDKHLSDLWNLFLARLEQTTRMDAQPRFNSIAKSLIPYLIDIANSPLPCVSDAPGQSLSSELFLGNIASYTNNLAVLCLNTHHVVQETYFTHHDATPFLGSAPKRMYEYIRYTLEVPFLRTQVMQTPGSCSPRTNVCANGKGEGVDESEGRKKGKTVGDYVSRIYEAIRNGDLYGASMACLRDVRANTDAPKQVDQSAEMTTMKGEGAKRIVA
ncbi:MAG: hypothetical protein Q9194_003386 [Teloschistes cf. exilis]